MLTLCFLPLYLSFVVCLSLIPCSLSAGVVGDVCCDAAVRDGPACLTLLGALHPHHLCCGGRVQARDEAVLGRNSLPPRGESQSMFKKLLLLQLHSFHDFNVPKQTVSRQ